MSKTISVLLILFSVYVPVCAQEHKTYESEYRLGINFPYIIDNTVKISLEKYYKNKNSYLVTVTNKFLDNSSKKEYGLALEGQYRKDLKKKMKFIDRSFIGLSFEAGIYRIQRFVTYAEVGPETGEINMYTYIRENRRVLALSPSIFYGFNKMITKNIFLDGFAGIGYRNTFNKETASFLGMSKSKCKVCETGTFFNGGVIIGIKL